MPTLSQKYDLTGRHVAVFGATGLVGSAVARQAAAAGARVTALGRDREKLDSLVDELGSDARARVVDLSPGATGPFDDGERVDLALTPLGGEIPTAELSALDVDTVDTLVHNKFMLQVRALQQALPHLADDGTVVLYSGLASRHPMPGYAALTAVNAGLEALAKAASEEAGKRVVCVASTFVKTGGGDGAVTPEQVADASLGLEGRAGGDVIDVA